MSLLTTALANLAQGISTIATDNNKRAIYPWKPFQSVIISEEEITRQLQHHKAAGIAVICGAVSGNLEVIDADLKYSTDPELWSNYMAAIPSQLRQKLRIIRTRSGGYHIYYRCEVIEGNQKLAMRHANEVEVKANPNVKQQVLLETRGEGGYVIAPPSEGYEVVQDCPIPILTADERELLLDAARQFNEVIEEHRPAATNAPAIGNFNKTPWEDYNERGDVLELLERHGWTVGRRSGDRTYLTRPGYTDGRVSADYHHGLGLFKVFTTSSQFDPGKGYRPSAVYAVLEAGGDFKMAARMLADRGYGERAMKLEPGIKAVINRAVGNGEDPVEVLVKKKNMSLAEAQRAMTSYNALEGGRLCEFWQVHDSKKGPEIEIVRHLLVSWLFDQGFHLYFYDDSTKIYKTVYTHEGLCEEVTVEFIKKHIVAYIESLPDTFDGITPGQLKECVMRGATAYFGKDLMEFLHRRDVKFLQGTPDAAFIPFRNGIVKVTSKTTHRISYAEAGATIWKREVIPFDVTVMDDMDWEMCEFYRFLRCVSGGDPDKLEYLLHLVGYLLHHYKDPARPYAVILAEETEDEKQGGGTGKGILVKALSYMVNLERVDGKNFKLDKNFAFQRVSLDTRIVAIEDVRKQVDFEGFYPIITEGMTVEKKNKDELFIQYKDSPKILFTTNYTISQSGNHAKRRQRVFEFSPHFSANHTPIDEFGHKLFDDWDDDEWNRFYNLMFGCISLYLENGIKEAPNTDKLKRKHIRLKYGEDFMDWFEAYRNEPFGTWKLATDLWMDFLNTNSIDKKDFSQTKFGRALSESAEMFGYNLVKERCKEQNNKLKVKLN